LLRPLDRVRISFSVPTLLRCVPALIIAESLAVIRVAQQRRKTVQTSALPSKFGPALKIGVEIQLSPPLRILSRSECPRRGYSITLEKEPRDADRRYSG
jgi:hypothetical protein